MSKSAIALLIKLEKLQTPERTQKKEAIKKAKDERFKSILMTSLSTILALIPVLLSNGIASDLQKPLAIVVICGLIVGTWSSITLLPTIYEKLRKESVS